MNVRPATAADRDALHRLYREFFTEDSPAPYEGLTVEDVTSAAQERCGDGFKLYAEIYALRLGFDGDHACLSTRSSRAKSSGGRVAKIEIVTAPLDFARDERGCGSLGHPALTAPQ